MSRVGEWALYSDVGHEALNQEIVRLTAHTAQVTLADISVFYMTSFIMHRRSGDPMLWYAATRNRTVPAVYTSAVHRLQWPDHWITGKTPVAPLSAVASSTLTK